MKKVFLILFAFLLFTTCSTKTISKVGVTAVCHTVTYDEGMVINGVRWATRNVDAPGTFANLPISPGMFFMRQGQRWRAWAIVSGTPFPLPPESSLDVASPVGPCPTGWRLPTDEEFHSLINAGSEIVQIGGVYGRFFGTAPHQIFLPATGILSCSMLSCSIVRFRDEGNYWSWCNVGGKSGRPGRGLFFSTTSNHVRLGGGGHVRCVAE